MIKRRVWVGLLTTVVGVGLWGLWNRQGRILPAGIQHSVQPFVQLAGAGAAQQDQLLRERAELLDPTPLFFPTEWNYGQQPVHEKTQRKPGQVFVNFEAQSMISDQRVGAYGVETIPAPEKLADVLVQGNEAPFAGMGQIDQIKQSTLPVRSGFIGIYGLKDSKIYIEQTFTGVQLPRIESAPVEYLVLIDAAGMVGEPVLVNSSGWDEVDVFFRNYLLKSYRLGERLAPGRYRVVIGA